MPESNYYLSADQRRTPLNLIYAGTVQARAAQQFNRPNWSYWTFEYVLDGQGFLRTDSGSFKIQKGDTYVLQEGKSYIYGASRKRPWKKIFFVLHGWLVRQLWQAYGLDNCNVVTDSSLFEYFQKMLELRRLNPPDLHQLAAVNFHTMLVQMHKSKPDPVSTYPKQVQLALSFIRENIEKPVTMEDISEAAKSSPAHLTRIFKAETGSTPYAYLLERRMDLARRLLKGTTMSVKEIASRLQYADAYYFSNAFKKHHKLSPRAWREREISHPGH